MSDTDCVQMRAMCAELRKLGGAGQTSKALHSFWEGAKHELGPALGGVVGAGVANAYGVNPLAGAGLGAAFGSAPDIVAGLRERSRKARAL